VTALLDAIAAGDPDAVRAALRTDPGACGRPGPDGVSPLLRCLYRGRRDLAVIVRATDPPMDLADAAALDDVAAVASLLAEGAEIDARTADGFTALHLAAFFDAPHAAALLIRGGADVDAIADNATRVAPIHSAVAGGSTAVVVALVAAGAEVDTEQQGGATALMAAAQHGDAAIVDLLLSCGADVGRLLHDGRSAGDLAAAGGYEDLAARLR
jgi:ankyrin repeat protein